MAAIKSVKSLYENLKAEWAKKEPNLDLCEDYLNKLKVNTQQFYKFQSPSLYSSLNIQFITWLGYVILVTFFISGWIDRIDISTNC